MNTSLLIWAVSNAVPVQSKSV